ncbi:MAG: peptidoglycan DD-metalloendopeptidase family protein [Pseudomonadales bacterium]|nr:peptidoglycan DD-metalloendopeptidase family protein [Pseudomonadales bacterium]
MTEVLGQVEQVFRETQLGQVAIETLSENVSQSFNNLNDLEKSVAAQKDYHQKMVENSVVKLRECEKQTAIAKAYADRSNDAVESSEALVKQNVELQTEIRQINLSTHQKTQEIDAQYQNVQRLMEGNESLTDSLSRTIETQKQAMQSQTVEHHRIVCEAERKLESSESTNQNLEYNLVQAQELNQSHLMLKEQFDEQLIEAKAQQTHSQLLLDQSLRKQEGYQQELADAQKANSRLMDKVAEYEGRLRQAELSIERSNKANQVVTEKMVETGRVNVSVLDQLQQFKHQNDEFRQQLEEAQDRNKETELVNKESRLNNKETRLTLRELRSDVNDIRQRTQKAVLPPHSDKIASQDIPVLLTSDVVPDAQTQANQAHQRILALEKELRVLRLSKVSTDDGTSKLEGSSKLDGVPFADRSESGIAVDTEEVQDRDAILNQLEGLADVEVRKVGIESQGNISGVVGGNGEKTAGVRNFILSTFITVMIAGAAGGLAYDSSESLATGIGNLTIISDDADMRQLDILLQRATTQRAEIEKREQGNFDLALHEKDSDTLDSYIWPLKSSATELDIRHQKSRNGLLIVAEQGTPVLAINKGRVVYSGAGIRGFGNLIIVEHEGELLSVYGNNDNNGVAEGDLVRKGQPIATVGDTGQEGAGLYFEIRFQGEVEDPYLYFADNSAV